MQHKNASNQSNGRDKAATDQSNGPDKIAKNQSNGPDKIAKNQSNGPDKIAKNQSNGPDKGATDQANGRDDAATDRLRLIKKYPNRRLYDTRTSAYITLADVKQLVLRHEPFQVVDAKTGEDLTRSILLQIILEEEAGGMPMFTSDLLSQLIRFYGNAMQGMVGNYLEKNMQTFVQVQKQLQDQSRSMFGDSDKVNKDLWGQFMDFQGSAMQGMMSAYMDQSKNVFMQMQDQLQNQTKNIFAGFPFPGFPGQPGAQRKDKGAKS